MAKNTKPAPIFHDEDAARAHLEAIRWPNGPSCPLCGCTERVSVLGGKSMGPGWFFCADCRGKFTVRTGTIYERSHVPLHKWVHAVHLLTASKKGMSAHQLHRMLGVTYKTAWFMAHRIRESMKPVNPGPMGGALKTVQADETYFGTKDAARATKDRPKLKGSAHKMAVVSLVSEGMARTFHVDRCDAVTVRKILKDNVRWTSTLHTDESPLYHGSIKQFVGHQTVNHSSGEYVSRKTGATTNHVENYFSVFKRGMKGVYQHCSEKHLQRYLTEFDFRFNHRAANGVEDAERALICLKGAEGKRLTYRRAH